MFWSMWIPLAMADVPAPVAACQRQGQLWLSDPDSFEPTEIERDGTAQPVWQIRDRQGGRVGYLLVYPADCRVVALVSTPSADGPPITQIIPPTDTWATSAEVRMLRRWSGLTAPVPSPCAQRWDTDGDGRTDSAQHYRYDDTTGGLIAVLTDDDGDGLADHTRRLTVDGWGRPLTSGGRSCADRFCSAAFTPQCPADMTCTVGPLGLIEQMQRGTLTVTNDYSCWSRAGDRWIFDP